MNKKRKEKKNTARSSCLPCFLGRLSSSERAKQTNVIIAQSLCDCEASPHKHQSQSSSWLLKIPISPAKGFWKLGCCAGEQLSFSLAAKANRIIHPQEVLVVSSCSADWAVGFLSGHRSSARTRLSNSATGDISSLQSGLRVLLRDTEGLLQVPHGMCRCCADSSRTVRIRQLRLDN